MTTTEISHRRQSMENKRRIQRRTTARTAAEAVGKIERGAEILGVSRGDYSLVDIMTCILDQIGPARVTLATWTAANTDLSFAHELLRDGRILDLRFVIDFSFPARQPQYVAALRQRFGDSTIRITKCHLKFVTLQNPGWNITLRTSMNLNLNRRWELWEISDDQHMTQFLNSIVDRLFETQAPESTFTQRPIEAIKVFERWPGLEGETPATAPDANPMNSTDVKKFFGDGPFDSDLRRSGLSYLGARKTPSTLGEDERSAGNPNPSTPEKGGTE